MNQKISKFELGIQGIARIQASHFSLNLSFSIVLQYDFFKLVTIGDKVFHINTLHLEMEKELNLRDIFGVSNSTVCDILVAQLKVNKQHIYFKR